MDNTLSRIAALMVLVTLASIFAMIGASHRSSRSTARAVFSLSAF